MNCKYITFDGAQAGWPNFAIMFPPFMEHLQMRTRFANLPVLGAGFVTVSEDCASVYGQSIGLGVKCHADDNDIINRTLWPPQL